MTNTHTPVVYIVLAACTLAVPARNEVSS